VETLCHKINKAQLNLPIGVNQTGGLILPTTSIPAHSSLSVNRCTGIYAERILSAELTLVEHFSDIAWKTIFLQKLGPNATLGSIEALIKAMTA
jgi:hypothetical protein